MFNNIGKKLKTLAVVIFVLDCLAALILAIVMFSEDAAVPGIIILLVLPLVAWISSWFLYGYGEIIDKLQEISYNTGTRRPTPTYGNAYQQNAYTGNAYQQNAYANNGYQQNNYPGNGYQQ